MLSAAKGRRRRRRARPRLRATVRLPPRGGRALDDDEATPWGGAGARSSPCQETDPMAALDMYLGS
eukprot:scaffold3621_cov288-Prasinococcus_capsulatus_cf.AAC.1